MSSTGQNRTEILIERLRSSVPSLTILERSKLPKIAAIYFVITEYNKLLYIGKAKNLFNSDNEFLERIKQEPIKVEREIYSDIHVAEEEGLSRQARSNIRRGISQPKDETIFSRGKVTEDNKKWRRVKN